MLYGAAYLEGLSKTESDKGKGTDLTRKDFELIAGVLRARYVVTAPNSVARDTVDNIALAMAKELGWTNNAFNADRFVAAVRNRQFRVYRDGKPVSPAQYTESDAHRWLQKHQGMSNDWAIQNEGYAIKEEVMYV